MDAVAARTEADARSYAGLGQIQLHPRHDLDRLSGTERHRTTPSVLDGRGDLDTTWAWCEAIEAAQNLAGHPFVLLRPPVREMLRSLMRPTLEREASASSGPPAKTFQEEYTFRVLCVSVVALACLLSLAAFGTSPASAHNDGCHRAHTCPSDHASYRWRGLKCVAPDADERNASFKKRVRYLGRPYFCKR